ncbi:hypothetical protein RMATCC62417_14903 [Rhizopus microsporus]|nr:hypothetical protein RMATCC62417_14903 [Rhizopus microsporus]
MAIASELYSRHATIDIYLETSVDSVLSLKCFYKGLSCSVIVSSDGKNLSKKLLIGSHTMNILITCSTTIATSILQEVFVGPQVNVTPTEFIVDSAKIQGSVQLLSSIQIRLPISKYLMFKTINKFLQP